MSSSSWNVHLERYEGPLDLLLDLIRKQQIDIHDIPIAQITGQYCAYLEQAAALDIELSAEFVYMAATLIHIKSRMLLPRDPELETMDPQEDPRRELVDRLLEHERFKNAAEMLHQKRIIEEATWSNPQISQFLDDADDPGLAVSLVDLVNTFQAVLERMKTRPTYEVDADEVSVPDMIRHLRGIFAASARTERVSAARLFEAQRSRRAMICLFLAILELVKRQALALSQSDSFGDIDLRRGEAFDRAIEEIPETEEEYR